MANPEEEVPITEEEILEKEKQELKKNWQKTLRSALTAKAVLFMLIFKVVHDFVMTRVVVPCKESIKLDLQNMNFAAMKENVAAMKTRVMSSCCVCCSCDCASVKGCLDCVKECAGKCVCAIKAKVAHCKTCTGCLDHCRTALERPFRLVHTCCCLMLPSKVAFLNDNPTLVVGSVVALSGAFLTFYGMWGGMNLLMALLASTVALFALVVAALEVYDRAVASDAVVREVQRKSRLSETESQIMFAGVDADSAKKLSEESQEEKEQIVASGIDFYKSAMECAQAARLNGEQVVVLQCKVNLGNVKQMENTDEEVDATADSLNKEGFDSLQVGEVFTVYKLDQISDIKSANADKSCTIM
jgi:hypothetical protein